MKILGFVDIIAGLLFTASFYGLDIPRGLMITMGAILIFKGALFISNFFSWVDLAAGVLLAFNLTPLVSPVVIIIAAVFFGIKGLVSLFSFS